MVPQTLSSYGDITSAAAGPHLWNSLPVQLHNPNITYGLFRRQLKGHLFPEAWTRHSVTSDMRCHRNILSYLLRIDKYLDTLLANQQLGRRCHRLLPKLVIARLCKLLLAYSCITNHSKAASLWLAMLKHVVGDHQWRVVCCNIEYINYSMQNLRPTNVKVIFQRPSCN